MSQSRRPSGVPLPPGFRRRESQRPDLGWSFPEPTKGGFRELGSQPPPRPSERPAAATSAELGRPTHAPAKVLMDRREAAEDHSLLRYWERLLYVAERQTPAQLETCLLVELEKLRGELLPTPAGQFVQLAVFDHEFESKPVAPPIATLSWKDWEGAPEIWVHGKWRSGPRSRAANPGSLRPSAPSRPTWESSSSARISGNTDNAAGQVLPPAPESPPAPEAIAQRSAVVPPPPTTARGSISGEHPATGLAGPAGRALTPVPPPTSNGPDSEAPPSSEPIVGATELVGHLFERMHEMLYLHDTGAGAQYILATIARYLPSAGVLIYVFDAETSSFVLVRARGPQSQPLLLSRTPAEGSYLEKALRQNQTLTLTSDQVRRGLWARLGVAVDHGLCAPVREGRKYLGAIELGRASGEPVYSQDEVHALDYICEQFAAFLSQRPLDWQSESLLPRG